MMRAAYLYVLTKFVCAERRLKMHDTNMLNIYNIIDIYNLQDSLNCRAICLLLLFVVYKDEIFRAKSKRHSWKARVAVT
jgi:hypothetical protein